MNLSELLRMLQALSRPEKWQLVQLLVADLAREEELPAMVAGGSYPVWSPYHAFGGADALIKALEEASK